MFEKRKIEYIPQLETFELCENILRNNPILRNQLQNLGYDPGGNIENNSF